MIINKIDVAIPQSVLGIFCDEKIDKEYLYYFLKTKEKHLINLAETGSQPNIKLDTIRNIFVYIPTLKEQNKIAKFLSLLDKQISLWERKLELSLLFFKYYLYKLIPNSNYDNLLRFSEFKNFNQIQIIKLENLVKKIKGGGTPKSNSDKYYKDGNIPFLSISDFKDKNGDLKYLTKTKKYITKLALNETTTYIVEKNNLIISIYATIGKVIINKIDVAIPQSVLGIFCDEKIDKEYLYYFLKTKEKHLINLAETGSQPNIKLDVVKQLNISLPNIKEQAKISLFLKTMDNNIQILKDILTTLNKRKKYYMNKLFI